VTPISLDQLPAPDIIETLDFEVIVAQMIADLRLRDPEFTALVESDPAYKVLEVAAYRELLLRARINNAARSVMLAYANGSDLDQIAAIFNVGRLPGVTVTISGGGGFGAIAEASVVDGVIVAVTPISGGSGYTSAPTVTIGGFGTGAVVNAVVTNGTVVAYGVTAGGGGYVQESDSSLRRRTQLALEGITTAGSEGSYLFHALSVPGVKDIGVDGPVEEPGRVDIAVLSSTGTGGASAGLIAAVEAVLTKEEIRPLTDNVFVASATINEYEVEATLFFNRGPDRELVRSKALAATQAYVAERHGCGRDISISGLYAALHQQGVSRVALTSPETDISNDPLEASFCTSITITDGGIDE
jgi:phage-related baseplate assembly protein